MLLDRPISDLYELLGHDGSGTPWPSPYQLWKEGFHIHEIIDMFWLHFSRTLTPIVRKPVRICMPDCPEQAAPFRRESDPESRFFKRLYANTGLLCGTNTRSGKGHTAAWNGHVCFDPRGYIYRFTDCDEYKFYPEVFWLMGEQNGNSPASLS